ncbi:alpha-2C adrenergic receptor isoform X1 [Drosophila subpulchrella]|uniref:alpha-2C adrenergic receptor isoform X1 n=1 Tax=Drosophila subpulchrella TaxID=1486046 RepID=UPI0018A16DFB|nr:alpha-2C adrenergic receptor isoform X1 [Drosophila subpulchrella]
MDYSRLNANINTGNISTDEFLAVFTTGKPENATLNPPLLSVDGQLTLPPGSGSGLGSGYINVNDTIYFLNGSFYNSSLQLAAGYYNQSSGSGATSGNLTNPNQTEVHWDGRYPSGYTLTHIVIASIIVTILMIIIVVGNMLVIIAIATEKSLKNIQNWFIASLAVADFFLGLIIMPFSLANELMGYWIFGSWWCDIHSAMDVLLCTASIMNLCLISLDRYWSITKAVDYLKSRTPARAAVMITAVWIMSALICIPPLLGWKVKMPEGPLPKCELSEDIGYVLYSALGSFYIPSCIMVFVYIRIYFAAKARARRGIKKHPRKTNNEQVTSFTTAKKGTIPMPSSSGASALQLHQQRQIATIETPPNSASLPMQIPTVTMDLASDISTSEAGELEAVAAQTVLAYTNPNGAGSNSMNVVSSGNGGSSGAPPSPTSPKETLQVSTIATGRVGLNVPVPPSMGSNNSINALNNNNGSVAMDGGAPSAGSGGNGSAGATTGGGLQTPGNELRVSPIAGRCRALSVGVDTDMVSEFDPSSSDSGVVSRCAVVKPLKFRLCQPIFGRKSSNQQRRNEAKTAAKNQHATATTANKNQQQHQHQQQQQQQHQQVVKAELEPAIPKTPKPRDPEKEKRRIARKKEKRATLILGLIMGSFIACWLPFFFLYILVPACSSHCNIPESAFAVAFWLGYMNSALNPAIYTIFNKDFRRAFRRILFK